MATITVDQQRLVLNTFAAIFQNNLVSKNLVTWKKFDGEMNDRNGLTVVEQVTPDYTTSFTTNGVKDLSSGVQDTTFGSEQYTIDQTINSSMGWGDFVKIRDIGSARESEALKAAALRLATDIDAYILGYAAVVSNNLLGDGDSDVSTWGDIASGYTRLKEEGVDDAETTAVLTYNDWQALGATVLADNASLTDLGEGMYRQGFTGKVAGIPTLFTQQLPAFTCGTRSATAALTQGATDAPVTYESVCKSSAPGRFMTQQLHIDIGAGTETVKDGDVFTIADVYAYDNRAKKTLGHLQQFRIVEDATAASGIVNARIYPAIITSGPYRTVSAAPADTAVVTFVGAASAVLHPRFIANKSAVQVSTADLIMPATGEGSRVNLTKVPMSVRMWKHSDFATGAHSIRFDVALKCNTSAGGRRRVVRINGS